MEGILLVNKPIDWTSFDVVNYIRRIIAKELDLKPTKVKVGHSGTLDPLAEGLLIILVGKTYTKRSNEFLKLDKNYHVSLQLGLRSKSFDLGTETEQFSDKIPDLSAINTSLNFIKNQKDQVPPNYSAIKIKGKRAYLKARDGEEFIIKKRPIKVYSIDLVSYKYPILELDIEVSSGTYIRSIVNDIGENLGTGAVMTKLTRLSIANYKLMNAINLQDLDAEKIRKSLILI